MFYFDAHCHLLPYKQLMKSSQAGIAYLLCNGTCPEDWEKLLDISKSIPGIYPCIGPHPWYVSELRSDWRIKMQLLIEKYPNLMIGEVGLDSTRPHLERQAEIFEFCLKMAVKYQRPVHIHGYKSWLLITDMLKCYPGLTCLYHRFSGSPVQVRQLMELTNAYFSVMTIRPVRYLPANRILVESDSPDGLHKPIRVTELVERLNLNWEQLDHNFCDFVGQRLPVYGVHPSEYQTKQSESMSETSE